MTKQWNKKYGVSAIDAFWVIVSNAAFPVQTPFLFSLCASNFRFPEQKEMILSIKI